MCIRDSYYSTGGQSVWFESDSYAESGYITDYYWDFGDDSSDSECCPYHWYSSPGYYDVCLTIMTSTGCSSTYCETVYLDAYEGEPEGEYGYCYCDGPAPVNDTCANALPVYFNEAAYGNNACAGTSTTLVPGHHDVWYSWTASYAGGVSADVCSGYTFDTRLAVFTGCGEYAVTENDDYCGYGSKVFFSAESGIIYYIRVSSYSADECGDFTLLLSDVNYEGEEWCCDEWCWDECYDECWDEWVCDDIDCWTETYCTEVCEEVCDSACYPCEYASANKSKKK